MTRVLQPSLPDLPADHRKSGDADSHLEACVAPAALLDLNRGAGREHKVLRDTCTPACTTTPAKVQDCLDCRNGTYGDDFDFDCNTCSAECTSPCDNEDCGIPQACFDEQCPTECQDKDCGIDICCGLEPSICTTTCFDENCTFPLANDFPFDPQLCELGECRGLSSSDSRDWLDFSQSHHFSNHLGPSMLTNNTPLWDHSIALYHSHHSHDHHTNHNISHKRRRLDGGSSQSSLQSHNCFDQSYAWPAFDLSFGSRCENLSFNFHSQQSAAQIENMGSGCHTTQHGHNFPHSGNSGSDNQFSLATNFSPSTSSTYFTSPPSFSHPDNSALFSETGSTSSGLLPPVVTDHEQDMASISCQLRLLEEHASSNVEHDPGCRMAGQSSKLTRQRSLGAEELSLAKSQTPNSDVTAKRSNRKSMEVSTTCQWIISDPHSELGSHICNEIFSNSQELDTHIQKEHTNRLGAQQFVCGWQGCNASFKHRGKLNRHISGAHSRYHAYECTHMNCGRTFCTKEQLKNHETTHTGEKKYKCRFCGHASATKTQHNTHERTHTKEKPYACPFCNHTSGDSSNLSKHVKNKHPEKRNLLTGQSRRTSLKLEKVG